MQLLKKKDSEDEMLFSNNGKSNAIENKKTCNEVQDSDSAATKIESDNVSEEKLQESKIIENEENKKVNK